MFNFTYYTVVLLYHSFSYRYATNTYNLNAFAL